MLYSPRWCCWKNKLSLSFKAKYGECRNTFFCSKLSSSKGKGTLYFHPVRLELIQIFYMQLVSLEPLQLYWALKFPRCLPLKWRRRNNLVLKLFLATLFVNLQWICCRFSNPKFLIEILSWFLILHSRTLRPLSFQSTHYLFIAFAWSFTSKCSLGITYLIARERKRCRLQCFSPPPADSQLFLRWILLTVKRITSR
jgi:hypothetical protein